MPFEVEAANKMKLGDTFGNPFLAEVWIAYNWFWPTLLSPEFAKIYCEIETEKRMPEHMSATRYFSSYVLPFGTAFEDVDAMN